ncbi:flavin reductase [Streptosporangium amethystogenes]|uniref:flavin reductase n=1 Tax=Streptosporangium amethystogenes TaxID=2002 RepID=UPI000A04C59B|nr:flavin reductase [Streptosporangium amethystogenes]
MATDGVSFRAVLAQWPSGVVIVTTGTADGEWHGMTASSFSSVSVDPPMVLVCLAKTSRTHHLVEERGTFAVSILGRDQAALGRRFAGQEPAPDGLFTDARWSTGVTGSPVLADSIGWLDCRVAHAYPGGDHTIFVGEVLVADTPRRVAPVLFHSRAWGQLADPLPDEVAVADTGLLSILRTRGYEEARLSRISRALRAAGTRVRLFDPYGDPLPADDLDPVTASALIAEPTRVQSAVRAGAGVVEFVVPAEAYGASAARAGAGPPALESAAATVEAARRAGLTTVAHITESFAEDRAEVVVSAVGRLADLGCDEIGLEEGRLPASPLRVRELLRDASASARSAVLRIRLRERNGIGMVNALVAMKSGIGHFDTTLGGVDGSLPGEDVLFLASQLEVASSVDRTALVAGATELESSWGSPLPGRTYRFVS